jgi:hypothetical protein
VTRTRSAPDSPNSSRRPGHLGRTRATRRSCRGPADIVDAFPRWRLVRASERPRERNSTVLDDVLLLLAVRLSRLESPGVESRCHIRATSLPRRWVRICTHPHKCGECEHDGRCADTPGTAGHIFRLLSRTEPRWRSSVRRDPKPLPLPGSRPAWRSPSQFRRRDRCAVRLYRSAAQYNDAEADALVEDVLIETMAEMDDPPAIEEERLVTDECEENWLTTRRSYWTSGMSSVASSTIRRPRGTAVRTSEPSGPTASTQPAVRRDHRGPRHLRHQLRPDHLRRPVGASAPHRNALERVAAPVDSHPERPARSSTAARGPTAPRRGIDERGPSSNQRSRHHVRGVRQAPSVQTRGQLLR